MGNIYISIHLQSCRCGVLRARRAICGGLVIGAGGTLHGAQSLYGCDARTGCICAMRCPVVVRDAMRVRCTGCNTQTSTDWLHLVGGSWLQLQAQTAPCF
jgi:hypothetical protein